MDGEKPEETREQAAAANMEKTRKKSISRSSTGESDEWILVNSLGNEVEHSACQVQSDVGTAADFTAPFMNNAAVSLSIDLKPMANCFCSTVATATKVEVVQEDTKQEAEDGALEITTSTISEASTVAVDDVIEYGIGGVVSHSEEIPSSPIKRSESSEIASQISLLDHNEAVLSSAEELPSSMASSLAASDFGGYEMVASMNSRADQTEHGPDEDEAALPALDDALPVNFVQAYGARIQNYIHAHNLSLNWKLSLLVVVASAAVLGLGLGHFIGSTHVWLSRQRITRQQEEQLRNLEVRLVECLNKLHQTRSEHGVLSDGCKDGYCEAYEKPSCAAVGDFEDRLNGCLQRLEICQRELNDVEQESKKRSAEMVKAFHDLRWMRSSLMQVHATYEKLSNVIMAEKKQATDESSMEELSRKLKEAENREEKLLQQEAALRATLASLESTVEALNTELAKVKTQAGGRKGQEKKVKETGDEADEDEGSTEWDFNWNRLSDLLQQLKDTTKVDQVFETYFDIFKDLKLPEINVSKLWLDQLPASLEEAAKTLKQGLDEKVQELEQTLYETNWDDYVQKAKDVTSRVGETVGTLWQKAKDLSDHVREQHGEQGEKIFNEIKTTVEKAAEVLDKRWEQATRFWRDVIGTRDVEDEEEEMVDLEQDDDKDQVWVYTENGNEEELWDEPVTSGSADIFDEPISSGSGDWFDHEDDAKDKTQAETKFKGEMKEPKAPEAPLKFDGFEATNEVKQLRESLKSSSVFSRHVTDEFADHYIRRLKQVGRSLANEVNDDSVWWLCQKLWWTRHSFANGRQCSDKLMSWQRHVRVDVDVRQKLIDESPQLKSLIKKFSKEDMPKLHDSANWVFEWAKNRQEMRQNEERKKNGQKESWLYERWRNRDHMRHQEEADGSDWMLQRVKGRQKKRGDEARGDFWQRRARSTANKEYKKQQNWQKQRR